MSWLDLVTNSHGLRQIFHGQAPALDGVDLHEISVGREGPTLRIRFDLRAFPADPPVKWRRSGFNAVQVELLFGGVSALSLQGVSVNMVADVHIEHDGKVSLLITSPAVRVTASADSVTIARIEGYIDGGRAAPAAETAQGSAR
ncbi:Imm50 family immunity protein [Micromonospora auratinigra]|uniref:Immunity protein 50 n=1 Tax=Micromonospora auratinigra TaxID=261654 RepID=A0A1A8Z2U3_9ACTN|nr:Imm50 family immunity protein [Micromonospora auratinigra]SBT38145.1 Immunity protein 50 [Micromonospora auratinigra]